MGVVCDSGGGLQARVGIQTTAASTLAAAATAAAATAAARQWGKQWSESKGLFATSWCNTFWANKKKVFNILVFDSHSSVAKRALNALYICH